MTTPTKLVANALKDVWKEKKYWLLGALIALTSPLASAIQFFQEDWINNADPTTVVNDQLSLKFTGLLRLWMIEHTGWSIAIGILVGLLFLAGLGISIVARAGMTHGIQQGTILREPIGKTWSSGKPFLWRLFLKSILIGAGVLIAWLPSVFSGFFLLQNGTTGSLLLLPIVLVSFLITLGLSFLDNLATPLLIENNQGITASLKQSWALLRRHWKNQLSIAIILWIAQIGVAIIATIASTGASFLILGASLSALKADQTAVLGLLLGIFVLVFIGMSLIFQGYLAALQQIVWTRYTEEISSKNKGQ